MIRKITGKLCDLHDQEAGIEIGAFEYQVLVPEFVRRQLQAKLDESVTLMTIEYLDGNPQKGRLTPRLVGFLHAAEREFFELICQVDGVGVKKALQAMVRPVQEVATLIEEQDIKGLSTLPGIGPAVAETDRRETPSEDGPLRTVGRLRCAGRPTRGSQRLERRV